MKIKFTNICAVLVAVAAGINVYVAQKRQQTEEQLLSLANIEAAAQGSSEGTISFSFTIPGRWHNNKKEVICHYNTGGSTTYTVTTPDGSSVSETKTTNGTSWDVPKTLIICDEGPCDWCLWDDKC